MTQVLSHPVHTSSYMDRPFGYAFFEQRDEPAPPPAPPAPGRPLLTENENNINSQLFSNIEDPRLLETLHPFQHGDVNGLFPTSSAFPHPDLNINHALNMFQQNHVFSAPQSAPAHTMTFPPHLQNSPFESQQSQAPHPHPPQAHTQPPHMPQHHRAHSNSFIKPLQNVQPAMARRPPAPAVSRPTMESFRRASSDFLPVVGDSLYNHAAKNMLREGRDARPDSFMERRMTFTYGSDTGFGASKYNPPKHVLDHTQTLEGRKINVVHQGYKGRPNSANGHEEPQSARSVAMESIDESDRDDFNPRKRHREDDSEDEDNFAFGLTRKKARPQMATPLPNPPRGTPGLPDTPTTPGGTGMAGRKASESKPSRINLTEEEKKQNHIRSEQKRRNAIKTGFADLVELIPDSASAGPSKCTILAKAVDWVSDLIEGNKKLREQLNQLNLAKGSS